MTFKFQMPSGEATTVGAVTADLAQVKLPTNGAFVARAMATATNRSNRAQTVQAAGIDGGAVVAGTASMTGSPILGGVKRPAGWTTATAAIVVSGEYAILRCTGEAGMALHWSGMMHVIVSE